MGLSDHLSDVIIVKEYRMLSERTNMLAWEARADSAHADTSTAVDRGLTRSTLNAVNYVARLSWTVWLASSHTYRCSSLELSTYSRDDTTDGVTRSALRTPARMHASQVLSHVPTSPTQPSVTPRGVNRDL